MRKQSMVSNSKMCKENKKLQQACCSRRNGVVTVKFKQHNSGWKSIASNQSSYCDI